jgi:ESF2/ABP1 family protein
MVNALEVKREPTTTTIYGIPFNYLTHKRAIKYLPKFKWDELTAQIAHELAVFEQKKRHEQEQAKEENKAYRKNVGMGKMLESIEEKKRKRGDAGSGKKSVHREFTQRKVVVEENAGKSGGITSVLKKIF